MTETTAELDMRLGGSIRDHMSIPGKRGKAWLLQKARPVVLVGRPVTSETQGFDTIINSNGTIKTQDTYSLAAGNPVDATGVAPQLIAGGFMEVGDVAEIFSTPAPGAVPAIQIANEGGVYEVYFAILRILNGVAVANRTMTIGCHPGITLRAWAAAANFITSAAGANVTAGQYGSVAWLPNGLMTYNANGAVVNTVGASPLPLKMLDVDFIWTAGLVNFAAADQASMSLVIRRVV